MQVFYLFLFPLFYGMADALWMKQDAKVPFYKSLYYRGVVSVLIAFIAALNLEITVGSTFTDWLNGAFVSTLSVLGFFLFYRSLQQPNSGLNSVAVKGISTVVAVVVSMYVANKFEILIFVATLLLIVGLCLLYIKKEKQVKLNFSLEAIAAGVIWGAVAILYQKPVQKLGSFWFAFELEFVCLLICVIILFFKKGECHIKISQPNKWNIILIGICTALGTIFTTLAYSHYSPGKISILGKFAILPPLFAAYILLNQKLNLKKIIGIILIVIAIVLVML